MLEQQALVQVKGTACRSPPGNCSSSHPFTGQTHSGKTLFCYPSHCWHRPSWLCPAPTLRGWRKSLFAQLLLPCKIHIGKEEEISFSNDWHLQILLCITNLFSYLMYRLCLQHLVAIRFLPKSDQKIKTLPDFSTVFWSLSPKLAVKYFGRIFFSDRGLLCSLGWPWTHDILLAAPSLASDRHALLHVGSVNAQEANTVRSLFNSQNQSQYWEVSGAERFVLLSTAAESMAHMQELLAAPTKPYQGTSWKNRSPFLCCKSHSWICLSSFQKHFDF